MFLINGGDVFLFLQNLGHTSLEMRNSAGEEINLAGDFAAGLAGGKRGQKIQAQL